MAKSSRQLSPTHLHIKVFPSSRKSEPFEITHTEWRGGRLPESGGVHVAQVGAAEDEGDELAGLAHVLTGEAQAAVEVLVREKSFLAWAKQWSGLFGLFGLAAKKLFWNAHQMRN